MGINVRHDVDPAITGTVAIMSGQGQYKRWLMEQQQRERMQQSQLDAQRQSQMMSLDAQRKAQEAARYDSQQRWSADKNFQIERDQWQDDNRTRDQDWQRKNQLSDIEAKRAYEEKLIADKTMRDNAGWDTVKPFELPPEQQSGPKQMPGMFKDIVEGTAAEWFTPGYGENPTTPAMVGYEELSPTDRDDWKQSPAERQWDLSQPRPDPDDYKLDSFSRRRINEINVRISQIRDASDLEDKYKAPALMRLQDEMNKVLKDVRPKPEMPTEPKIVSHNGRDYIQDSKGGFKPLAPEKASRPDFSPEYIDRAVKAEIENSIPEPTPENLDPQPALSPAEAYKRVTERLAVQREQSAESSSPTESAWNQVKPSDQSYVAARMRGLILEYKAAQSSGDQARMAKVIAEYKQLNPQSKLGN